MATFTPPTTPDLMRGDYTQPDAANRLFGRYPPQEIGMTVWKDPNGVWHSSAYPYKGGNSYRTFDNGILISEEFDDPSESIASAEKVFLGGHTYEIDFATLLELINAGFGDTINQAPILRNHWETEDAQRLTKFTMSTDAPNVTGTPTVDSLERVCFALATSDDNAPSTLREYFVEPITSEDFYATTILDPMAYGTGLGTGGVDILPQQGLGLRIQESGGVKTGISVNNNIFFVLQKMNIGVWRANSDGSGFNNRQFSMPNESALPYPHALDVDLTGNIIKVRVYPINSAPPAWDSGDVHVAIVNLDTDAGDSGLIPTPTGEGAAGYIVNHLGGDPLSVIRYGKTEIRRKDASGQIL